MLFAKQSPISRRGLRLPPSAMALVLVLTSSEAFAFDSYRYLHVTIETPWAIFLFLLPVVLSPFILMAFLYWRFATRRAEQPKQAQPPEPDETLNR